MFPAFRKVFHSHFPEVARDNYALVNGAMFLFKIRNISIDSIIFQTRKNGKLVERVKMNESHLYLLTKCEAKPLLKYEVQSHVNTEDTQCPRGFCICSGFPFIWIRNENHITQMVSLSTVVAH